LGRRSDPVLVQAMPPPPISLFLATRVLEGAAHLAIVVAAPISAYGVVLTSLASPRFAGDSNVTSPQRV